MTFAIVATGIILVLLVLGLVFLPSRESWEAPTEIADPYESLYSENRGRVDARPRERSKLSRERNGNDSRPSERAGELGEDGQIGVERDPIEPSDTEGR